MDKNKLEQLHEFGSKNTIRRVTLTTFSLGAAGSIVIFLVGGEPELIDFSSSAMLLSLSAYTHSITKSILCRRMAHKIEKTLGITDKSKKKLLRHAVAVGISRPDIFVEEDDCYYVNPNGFFKVVPLPGTAWDTALKEIIEIYEVKEYRNSIKNPLPRNSDRAEFEDYYQMLKKDYR